MHVNRRPTQQSARTSEQAEIFPIPASTPLPCERRRTVLTSNTVISRLLPRLVPPTILVTAALALAGCGDDAADQATTAAPPVTSSPSAAPPTSTAPTPAPAAGCAESGGDAPAGAASITTIDVDGDGQADTLWVATGEQRTVGITTASGATFTHPVDLAGPTGATAFALQPDEDGPADVLVSDGRAADLLAVQDCALVDVTDSDGQPWSFDLGFTGYGTGVGCLDLDGDGARDLVGLNLAPSADQNADRTGTRTVIHVEGTVATAGAEDVVTVPATDQAGIDTAGAITCGDRTAAADGVHEPEA